MKATDFYLEPLATFLCIGTGLTATAGDAPVDGAGGGYASKGGGGKLSENLSFGFPTRYDTHCSAHP